MGGRGAVSVATPSLPSNAGQSWSIRVFAGVCGLGLRFTDLAGPPRITSLSPITSPNLNKTRGGTVLATFLPPSASPPPSSSCLP